MTMDIPVTPKRSNHQASNSQVRFSLPDLDEVHGIDNITDIIDSPSKIVFPTTTLQIDNKTNHEMENGADADDEMNEDRKYILDNQIMDLSSNVMVTVPLDIWKYHSEKKTNTSNKNELRKKTHKKTKSLQSIIMNTIDTLQMENQSSDPNKDYDASDISNISPLNFNENKHQRHKSLPTLSNNQIPFLSPEKAPNLYLTTDSPLNKYNVPVPLQISLPPYLSPKNKNKKQNSLVYDGNGYSAYEESISESESQSEIESDEYHTNRKHDSNSLLDSSGIESIISSIAPEEHKLSLHNLFDDENSDFNIDDKLGIDEFANVNLKLQNRNIKNKDFSKTPNKRSKNKTKIIDSRSSLPIKVTNTEEYKSNIIEKNENDIKQQKEANMINGEKLDSLMVLSTPLKHINIPDLDREKTPQTKNGTLKFFDHFEASIKTQPLNTLGDNQGQLSKSFKFPADTSPNDTNLNILDDTTTKNDDNRYEDFIKIDNNKTTKEFESRRQMLLQNRLTPNGKNINHVHRRSRSIHNANEIFEMDSITPPNQDSKSDETITLSNKLPERSNKRPTASFIEQPFNINANNNSNRTEQINNGTTRVGENCSIVTDKSKELERAINAVSATIAERETDLLHSSSNLENPDNELTRNSLKLNLIEENKTELEDSSVYEESDSNSIVPSLVESRNQSDFDASLDNMTNYSYQSLSASEDDTTIPSQNFNNKNNMLDAIRPNTNDILHKNLMTSAEKNSMEEVNKLNITNLNTSTIKPLSLFQSFSKPLSMKQVQSIPAVPIVNINLIEKESIEEIQKPTRSLSNTDSTSSYNSQFSRLSHQSSISSYKQDSNTVVKGKNNDLLGTSYHPYSANNKNMNYNNTYQNSKNNGKNNTISNHANKNLDSLPTDKLGYQTILEQREGKLVEVILIDDNSDDKMTDVIKNTDNISKYNTLINSKSKKLLSRNNPQESSKKNKLKKGLKSHRRTKSCPSHEDILNLCEEVAGDAKTIIYSLVNENINKVTKSQIPMRPQPPNSKITQKHTWKVVSPITTKPLQNDNTMFNSHIMTENQQHHYLQNMNRSRKTLSMVQ